MRGSIALRQEGHVAARMPAQSRRTLPSWRRAGWGALVTINIALLTEGELASAGAINIALLTEGELASAGAINIALLTVMEGELASAGAINIALLAEGERASAGAINIALLAEGERASARWARSTSEITDTVYSLTR